MRTPHSKNYLLTTSRTRMKWRLLISLLFILFCGDVRTAVIVKAAWVVESFDNFGGSGPQQPLHINLAERLVSFASDKCQIGIKTKISGGSHHYGLSVSARDGRGLITLRPLGNIMNKALDRTTIYLTDAHSERVLILYDWSKMSWTDEEKLRMTLKAILAEYNGRQVTLPQLSEQVFDIFKKQAGGMLGCVLAYGVTNIAVSSTSTDPYYYGMEGDGMAVDYAAICLHPNHVVYDQDGPEWIYISESIGRGGRRKNLALFSLKRFFNDLLLTMKRLANGRLTSFGPRSITDHEIRNVKIEGDSSMATIVLNAQHPCIFTLFWVELDPDMGKWRHIQVGDLYEFTKDLTCDSDSLALMAAMHHISHFLLPQTPAVLFRHSKRQTKRLSPVSDADDKSALIENVPEGALDKIPISPHDDSEAVSSSMLTVDNAEIPPTEDPDVTESLEEPSKLKVFSPPSPAPFDYEPLAAEASESIWMNFVNPTLFD